MNIFVTVIASVLVFGFLIFIHEFGHYIFARIFKVTITDFSIGMGPRLVSFTSKKTNIRYALSALPIGGYVAMAGEMMAEEGTEDYEKWKNDPNTFDKKPAWQRFIITAAGAAVNIVTGFLVIVLLGLIIDFGGTTVAKTYTPEELGTAVSTHGVLMPEDEIISIDGKRVDTTDELSYEIMRRATVPIDIEVIRNGERVTLTDVVFPTVSEQGQVFGAMDFSVYRTEKTFGSVFSYSWSKSVLTVRMCFESIYDLLTGRYTFAAVSGPVGISSVIGDAVSSERAGVNLLSLVALISINLGIMNLIPFPALDGGRLILTASEMVTRRRIPPKVENMINFVGLALLLTLSVVILVKDVIQLII